MNRCLVAIGLVMVLGAGCAVDLGERNRMAREAMETSSYLFATVDQFEGLNCELFEGPLKGWQKIDYDATPKRVEFKMIPAGETLKCNTEVLRFSFSAIGRCELDAQRAMQDIDMVIDSLGVGALMGRRIPINDCDAMCEMILKPSCPFYFIQRFVHKNGVLISFQYENYSEDLDALDKAKYIDMVKNIKIVEVDQCYE